jgi:hypothetical protein
MTRNDIRRAFTVLETAGVRPPFDSAERAETAVETWLATLPDIDGDALQAAVQAHLRVPNGRWWPKPVDLLEHIPRAPKPVEPVLADWPGRRWSQLADGDRRVRLLDQAVAEILARSPRPCGKPKCSPTCEACNTATMHRADALALQHAVVEHPLVEPPTEYDDALHRAGLRDDDEVVDQGAPW